MENATAAEWQPETADVTLEQFDSFVKDYAAKREAYEAAKKVSSEKYSILQDAENKLIAVLKATNKKNYKVDSIGTISRVVKEVVTTPKTLEAKSALFDWIEAQYGEEVLGDMVSINHQKLNSFYNEEVDKHKDDPMFNIPGLEAPTMVESLSFRRS
jgi:hypothetical protein